MRLIHLTLPLLIAVPLTAQVPTGGQWRRARDHGLTAGFARRAAAHGNTSLSLDELVRMRDRGLDN